MDYVNLSIDEQRYKRHVLLPQVGVEGQEKIQKSKVRVIGAGGLGSPVLMYLAAAGVGTIGIADFDRVDISNLQRQILYTEKDVRCSKAEVAKKRLLEMNSKILVECIKDKIDTNNVQKILSNYDIIVDVS